MTRHDLPYIDQYIDPKTGRDINPKDRRATMDPQATAGRIVHYYSANEDGPRAAIVNRDTGPDGYAELTILRAYGSAVQKVSYSEQPQPGCWSWMPYQKAKAETAEGNVSESAEPRPGAIDRSAPAPESAELRPPTGLGGARSPG